jgi:hypothetical protein
MNPSHIVDAPLRGEWVALQTPAHRVPSHGTDYLGQRYAFDFIRTSPRTDLPYERGFWRHLLGRLPAESFLCWDQPVHSVFDGVVRAAGDGWPDRLLINLVGALLQGELRPGEVSGSDIRPLAGNYMIVEGASSVAFYAHLRRDSLLLRTGDAVRAGEVIGRVGNSGNSSMPHLHFHLMDSADILAAAGVPVRFRSYARLERGAWVAVDDGVPGKLERIRW